MFRLILVLALVACIGACASPSERGAGHSGYLVTSADPAASEAGAKVLKRGGSAVDAAVAVQTALGLVEPQSSGLGGGAFLVYFDAKTGKVTTYDGRETAPAATTPDQFLDEQGKPKQFPDKILGGKSVGVPGVMRMLARAHGDHGKLAWASLFDDAIALAQGGFEFSRTLHQELSFLTHLKDMPDTRAYFYDAGGNPLAEGARIRNPAYAKTLRALAQDSSAINEGPIAGDIAEAVTRAPRNPQAMTLKDLASYQPKERAPVCGPYRAYIVCGMGPPSSGGVAILQVLTMLERFPLPELGPKDPQSWHLIAEAERLAYADRAQWLGDSDFVDVPLSGLLDRDYLMSRSMLIDPERAALKRREAGFPPIRLAEAYAPGESHDIPSTTHFSIVDKDGNVASMTSSIEFAFGSALMVDGFLLNNQLTDFSTYPTRDGKKVANAAAPFKRPLSSMSPTIVLDKDGHFVMAIGSPGGGRIIGYVVKAIIAALDWNLPMQEAVDLPNFVNTNGQTQVEDGEPGAEALKGALEALGHDVILARMRSGLHGFRAVEGGYEGAADKRREGEVAAEKPRSNWPRLRMPAF